MGKGPPGERLGTQDNDSGGDEGGRVRGGGCSGGDGGRRVRVGGCSGGDGGGRVRGVGVEKGWEVFLTKCSEIYQTFLTYVFYDFLNKSL